MAAVATNGEVWLRLSISFAALRITHVYNDAILFCILILRIHSGNCLESSGININLYKDLPYLKNSSFKIHYWKTEYVIDEAHFFSAINFIKYLCLYNTRRNKKIVLPSKTIIPISNYIMERIYDSLMTRGLRRRYNIS